MKYSASLSIGLAFVASACTPGRNVDKQVQICLHDDRGVAALRSILLDVSRRYKLEFFDQSADLEADRAAGLFGPKTFGVYPIPAYHMHDKAEGVEITATNLGLGKYQSTISWDLRTDKQRLVANDLTKALQQQFVLQSIPETRGALPLGDCPDTLPVKTSTKPE